MNVNKERLGSSFDSFLEDEGILEDVHAEAVKRVLAWQVKQFMEENQLTKSAFAKQIETSRAQLDRVLNPTNTSLNLNTMCKIATAMGKKIDVRFV